MTTAVSAARDHGLGSPDFIRMTPTPIPWTYIDSFWTWKTIQMDGDPVELEFKRTPDWLRHDVFTLGTARKPIEKHDYRSGR